MNISGILRSAYINNVINAKKPQGADVVSTATKVQKIDTISRATIKSGGDHYFEAKA